MDKVQRPAIFAIWFVQFTQAVSITMPYSVVVFMVRDFIGASTDAATESQIGTAAGLLAGVYSIAQFLSSYAWGYFSDHYGRKPCIQIGIASSFVSIVALGFSTTYSAAAWSRFFGGLFNGYLVALKSSIGELFDEDQQAQALGYLTFGWGAGSIFGPVLGGFLMHPCDKYALGNACSNGGTFQRFPYLLPYLFAAFTALLSMACTHYMLPETCTLRQRRVGAPTYQRSLDDKSGLLSNLNSWRRWLASFVGGSASTAHEQEDKLLSKKHGCFSCELEMSPTARGTPLAAFHSGPLTSRTNSRTNSTFSSITGATSMSLHDARNISEPGKVEHHGAGASKQLLPTQALAGSSRDGGRHVKNRTSIKCIDMVSKACMAVSFGGDFEGADELTTQISDSALLLEMDTSALRLLVLLIYGYGIIAFSFCLMDEVVPIYASTPRLHNGLGMNGRQLSIPLSVGGGVLMFVSIFLYPVVQRKIGCHRCVQIGLLMFICSCVLFPTCTIIDRGNKKAAYIAFTITTCIRCVSAAFTFTSSMVLINLAANRHAGNQIGEVNGAGQALVAFVRGVAPFLGGYFWSVSVASKELPASQYAVFLFDIAWSFAALALYQHIKNS